MRWKFSLFTLLIVLPNFISCRKSLYDVRYTGRVLTFFTNKPVQGTVTVEGEGGKSDRERGENIFLGAGETDADGVFDFVANGSSYDDYFLTFPTATIDKRYTKTSKKELNAGTVFVGNYSFYCKVNLVSKSGNSIQLISFSEVYPRVNSGTTTTILHLLRMDAESFEAQAHQHRIIYELYNSNGMISRESRNLPITNGDTLSTTIEF